MAVWMAVVVHTKAHQGPPPSKQNYMALRTKQTGPERMICSIAKRIIVVVYVL